MAKGQSTDQLDAFALFPDLMQKLQAPVQKKRTEKTELSTSKLRRALPKASHKQVLSPPPPDLSWLEQGDSIVQEKGEDIPVALVLMGNEQKREHLSADLQELGYRVELAETSAAALDKLQFTHYAAIVMHVEFAQTSLAESAVYRHVTWLPAEKRRALFFILVGPELHTLYNLEALSLSVNLVVNDADIDALQAILRKSFRDHEELFGPLLEAVDGYGKG